VTGARERQAKLPDGCPHCGHWDSLVVQGWASDRGYIRRRKCANCHRTFRTRETIVLEPRKPHQKTA